LDLKFEPLKIAVMDSGRFLVAGLDTLNKIPILAILETDGTFVRSIALDNRLYDDSKSQQSTERSRSAL
jgi:hypothetical protein